MKKYVNYTIYDTNYDKKILERFLTVYTKICIVDEEFIFETLHLVLISVNTIQSQGIQTCNSSSVHAVSVFIVSSFFSQDNKILQAYLSE